MPLEVSLSRSVGGGRERDGERLKLQQVEGIYAGHGILKTQPTPTPLTPPKRQSRPLSAETAVITTQDETTEESG